MIGTGVGRGQRGWWGHNGVGRGWDTAVGRIVERAGEVAWEEVEGRVTKQG